MKTFLRNMLPGIWLILALPLSALLVTVMEPLAIKLPVDRDVIMQLAFFISHLVTGYLWAQAVLNRAGRIASPMAGLAAGTAYGLLLVGVYIFFEAIFTPLGNLFEIVGATHLEFRLIFTTWTAVICGGTGLAFGLGLRNWRLALMLGLAGLLTGGGIFFLTAIGLHTAGFHVGTPRPDGIPSMPVITVTGIWLTALIGSGIFTTIVKTTASPVEEAVLSTASPAFPNLSASGMDHQA